MKIPLPGLMRRWREKAWEAGAPPAAERYGVGVWAWFARRPWLYGLGARLAMRALARLGRGKGSFKSLPLAGGWTEGRDFPAPEGRTFQEQWRARGRRAA